MELLAPVGSLASFEAALDEGADAIYLGAPECNARALNKDFTTRELEGMLSVARKSRVKVYFAMNSLVKEDEVARVVQSLALYEALKPDALIIQDWAILSLVSEYFPSLTLHASTLMLVNNSRTVSQLVDMGFSRVVLPRELTIREISKIYQKTKADLEVFVQGAMCFSYSGLCLFSTMHGGKSSLRGRCVQPCRRSYTTKVSNKKTGKNRKKKGAGSGQYLFSMNDLTGINLLADLKRAGVCSLKIEGRMKSGNYVGKTTRAYRMVLDNLDADEQQRRGVIAEASILLDEAMGRKATSGYFQNANPRGVITHYHSGNSGMFLGKVQNLTTTSQGAVKAVFLSLILKNTVQTGDRLRIHIEKTGERQGFTLRSLWAGNKKIREGRAGQKVRLAVPGKFEKLGRIRTASLYKVDVQARRSGGKKIGRLLAGRQQKTTTRDKKKLQRIVAEITYDLPEASKRPRVHLEKNRDKKGRSRQRATGKKRHTRAGNGISWWIKIDRPTQVFMKAPVRVQKWIIPLNGKTLLEYEKNHQKMRRFTSRLIWSLPAVINEEKLSFYDQSISRLVDAGFFYWQLGHRSQMAFFESQVDISPGKLQFSGDYTFNILNSVSLLHAYGIGFDSLQVSVETDRHTLRAILQTIEARLGDGSDERPVPRIGLTVFGRLPLFTARVIPEHCNTDQRPVSPRGESFIIKKEEEITRVHPALPFSLLAYTDELKGNGIDFMVIDLRGSNFKSAYNEIMQSLHMKMPLRGANSGNYPGILQ